MSQPLAIMGLSMCLDILLIIISTSLDYNFMSKSESFSCTKIIFLAIILIKNIISMMVGTVQTISNWTKLPTFFEFIAFEVGYELESNMTIKLMSTLLLISTICKNTKNETENDTHDTHETYIILLSLFVTISSIVPMIIVLIRFIIFTILFLITIWPYIWTIFVIVLLILCVISSLLIMAITSKIYKNYEENRKQKSGLVQTEQAPSYEIKVVSLEKDEDTNGRKGVKRPGDLTLSYDVKVINLGKDKDTNGRKDITRPGDLALLKFIPILLTLLYLSILPGLRLYGFFLPKGNYLSGLKYTSDLRPTVYDWIVTDIYGIVNLI